jgi:hypothetical protein
MGGQLGGALFFVDNVKISDAREPQRPAPQ